MSTDEQAERTVGSVPNAYGNAIAWRWARQLPTSLKRTGFLTLLYALRAIAAASGELRFPDGKAIRIQDIAKAAGCDERDARDRIGAALAAGVVAVKGERRRGVATLYALVIHPQPDWAAAAAFIAAAKLAREEAKAERARRKAALRAEEAAPEFGGASPEPEGRKFGEPSPELTAGTPENVRGTHPRLSSGGRPPIGSGNAPPNNPGTHGFPMGGAGVVSQPQVDWGWEQEPPVDDEPPDADPDGPNLTALEGGGRSPGGQSPLLLPVPSAKAAVADYRQLAEDLAALYGVRVAVRQAAAIALDVLGNQRPADPTAYVIERVRANPDPYRPALPTTSSRRRRASGDT